MLLPKISLRHKKIQRRRIKRRTKKGRTRLVCSKKSMYQRGTLPSWHFHGENNIQKIEFIRSGPRVEGKTKTTNPTGWGWEKPLLNHGKYKSSRWVLQARPVSSHVTSRCYYDWYSLPPTPRTHRKENRPSSVLDARACTLNILGGWFLI